MGNNYLHYSYRVSWSKEDNEYVGLCSEFPMLSCLNKDITKALRDITNLVRDVIDDMNKNSEKVPDPISMKKFSGKLLLRISSQRHRDLSLEALEQGVSLNHYIADKLAS